MYLDLDGTLLGPGASVLRGGGGAWSDDGPAALRLLHQAGVPVVLVSGRSRQRLETSAELLGADGALPELGALDCGYPTAPGQTVNEAIRATGIVDALLAREPALEVHPAALWGREGSHVFRGRVGADAAEWVAATSAGTLRLADNGGVGPGGSRVVHLLPAGAGKAGAVARDIARRGAVAGRCLAVGDSREDAAIAGVVGWFALVGNGAAGDPELAASVSWVTRGHYGSGVREAVDAWLAATS